MEGDIQIGRWLVQPKLNSVSGNGKTARVEPKVMQVLVCLAEHAGDVVEKERLLRAVWTDTFVTDDVLTRAISELRRALNDDPQKPQFIETIPKRGYRLIAPVETVGEPVGAVRELPQQRRRLALIALPVIALLLILSYIARQRFWPKVQAPTAKIRLVVLPFDNLSGDADQEYFSDGMTEELTAQLARLNPERLLVIGRTSAMTFKGHKKTIEEIGKELGVQYALEGSVRRAGERVRITAQLIEVGDQTHLWAEEYDRDLRDILAVQGEVARGVARETQLMLTPQQEARAASRRPVSPEAHEAYLRGLYLWNRRTKAEIGKSTEYFREAIRMDPGYALAYARLASSLDFGGDHDGAKAAVLKAINLDNTLAEAHVALALIEIGPPWDWPGVEEEFRRGLELDPAYPTAHHWYSFYLQITGRGKDALREARRAVELDPLSLIIRVNLADVLAFEGRTDESLEESHKVLELDPSFVPAHNRLGITRIRRREYREAIQEFRKAKELGVSPNATSRWLGYAYAMSGERAKAEETIQELQRWAKQNHMPPPAAKIAWVYVGLGNKEQSLRWLEKAFAQGADELVWLKVDPVFDPLRSDPRFQDLLRRMNFPP